jgi:hypothetical protein
MELQFHYNKDTRRIESDDPDIFVKPRGGVEEAQSLVLHWHERKIPFSAKLEETTNSDGVTEVRWTIN